MLTTLKLSTQLFLFTLFLALTGCTKSVEVETSLGFIEGIVLDDVHQFKGVPFAKPPTGEFRWQPPRPVDPWEGTLDAKFSRFGCIQGSNLTAVVKQSEDCLYLMVTRPAEPSKTLRPVMFWIHGGSYEIGAGNEHQYYPDRLSVREDVIVVNVNYRLGYYGFLSLPELSEESGTGFSGNYFHQDQAMALEWVKDNIESFGGDPDNIAIFGESAGGTSTCLHLVSPLSKGLFHKAIIQSGSCARGLTTIEDAEEEGLLIADTIGCTEDRLSCLRSMSPKQFGSAVEAAFGGSSPFTGSVLSHAFVNDGTTFFDDPLALLASGYQSDIPVIMGNNKDEGTLFAGTDLPTNAEEYTALLQERMGEDAAAVEEMYPLENYKKPADAVADISGDTYFVCRAKQTANALVEGGNDVYFYHFTYRPTGIFAPFMTLLNGKNSPTMGVYHTAEIPYVFGKSSFVGSLIGKGEGLSLDVMQYWAEHARKGSPNTDEGYPWPQYSSAAEEYLDINLPLSAKTYFKKDICDFWASIGI